MRDGFGPGSSGRRAAVALVAAGVLVAMTTALMGDGAYLWVKSIHIVAVISWMAGLLYLPRLFIYHCAAPVGSVESETFKVMEQRLLGIIMTPAMVVAWVLGGWLAWRGHFFLERWMIGKLVLVLALSGFHGYLARAVGTFADDRNEMTARHWRIANEIPTVLMIGIVVLVVVKPL